MRRWVLRPGLTGLDRLQIEDVPIPVPSAGEVRVRVHSVSLNYRDQLILTGESGVVITEDLVPVSDGAGEIDAIGDDVDTWAIGNQVTGLYFEGWRDGPPKPNMGRGLGSPGQSGMLSEYVVLKTDRIARMPRNYTYDQAATLPCAALTAWNALYTAHPVSSGDKVLITGSGGVALFALLFARESGADVTITTSQELKTERLREMGATDVINYRTSEDWGNVAFERTGGMDKIVNAAGGGSMNQSIAAVGFGGEIAVMGLFSPGDRPFMLPSLMAKGATIRGISVGSASNFEAMVSRIDTSMIVPPIDRVFGFEDVRAAYEAQRSRDSFGKVVIKVSS